MQGMSYPLYYPSGPHLKSLDDLKYGSSNFLNRGQFTVPLNVRVYSLKKKKKRKTMNKFLHILNIYYFEVKTQNMNKKNMRPVGHASEKGVE